MLRRQKKLLGRMVGQVKRTPAGGAGPMVPVQQARDRMAPAMENVWDRMGPTLDDARDRAAAAMVSAMEASEPFREEARRRRRAAMLALRGELRAPEPRRRHWMRTLVMAGGAGGLALAGYRMFRDGHAPWHTSEGSAPSAERPESGQEQAPAAHRATPTRDEEEEVQAPPPGLS